ncbi:MAG: hypothetical protein LUG23_07040 [Oscillospiraceae bacterium]|nr:hypothetical protein [Oscillospiraceae bacterium]
MKKYITTSVFADSIVKRIAYPRIAKSKAFACIEPRIVSKRAESTLKIYTNNKNNITPPTYNKSRYLLWACDMSAQDSCEINDVVPFPILDF